MEHYYEVMMCRKFLNYVKEYYPDHYSKFAKLEAVTSKKLFEVDRYINSAIYTDYGIEHKLFSGELLSEMIYLFRSSTGCESLTLMIDRFVWTHNSEPRV